MLSIIAAVVRKTSGKYAQNAAKQISQQDAARRTLKTAQLCRQSQIPDMRRLDSKTDQEKAHAKKPEMTKSMSHDVMDKLKSHRTEKEKSVV